MPKFKYKAKSADSDAAKLGYLEAPNLQAAQKYLDKKGVQVEWVRGVGRSKSQTDSAELVVAAGKKIVYGKDHDVGQYRPSFGDFVQDHKPPKEVIRLILGLCSVLGVLVIFATWGGSARAGQRESNKEIRYKVQVLGQVDTPSTPDGLTLTVSFPEIPYRQVWQGSEAVGDNGQIKTELEFLTRRQAGHCDVELSCRGQKTIQKQRLSLSGFDSTIDLGTLNFSPSSFSGRSEE